MSHSDRPDPRVVPAEQRRDGLFATAFIASWLGRARPSERFVADVDVRAAGWAHWAASQLTEIDTGERTYPAVWLDGLFYDPKGNGPKLRPHLEVPGHALEVPDEQFADRLAQMGNGLAFEWWLYPEVTALRRALFNTARGDVTDIFATLTDHRADLEAGLVRLNEVLAPQFSEVSVLLQTADDGLSAEVTGDFTTDEVAAYFPDAERYGLRVTYDDKLRSRSGSRASRRVGIWQVHGRDDDRQPFSFGVVTPRLTQRSTLTDRLFDPATESPAALLVRALIIRRLLSARLDTAGALDATIGKATSTTTRTPAPPSQSHPTPHLRAVPARVNQRLPSASVDAAVHFVTTHPDADDAWRALKGWAGDAYAITVAEAGFKAAHRSAAAAVQRAEDPARDDIDVLLPLGWADGKLVRVTFSRPPADPDAEDD